MIHRFEIAVGGREPIDMTFDLDPAHYMTDDSLQRYFDAQHVPEPELVHLLAHVLQPGDVAIDGGANVGFFTILMSRLVGPDGLVIAVEPSARNRNKLVANLALNACNNVTVRPEALSSNSNSVRFYEKSDNGEDGCFGEGEYRMVPAVTLETLALGRIVRLVKLDIEGSEVHALRGAGNLLHKGFLPFLICETSCSISGSAFSINTVMRQFSPTWDRFILSESGTIPALVPDSCTLSPQRMNSNLLFSTMEHVAEAWREVRY